MNYDLSIKAKKKRKWKFCKQQKISSADRHVVCSNIFLCLRNFFQKIVGRLIQVLIKCGNSLFLAEQADNGSFDKTHHNSTDKFRFIVLRMTSDRILIANRPIMSLTDDKISWFSSISNCTFVIKNNYLLDSRFVFVWLCGCKLFSNEWAVSCTDINDFHSISIWTTSKSRQMTFFPHFVAAQSLIWNRAHACKSVIQFYWTTKKKNENKNGEKKINCK